MKRLGVLACGLCALMASVFIPPRVVYSADKIKFPYSPIGWESLAWYVAQVAALVKTFTIPLYSQPSIKSLADLKGQKVGVSRP